MNLSVNDTNRDSSVIRTKQAAAEFKNGKYFNI